MDQYDRSGGSRWFRRLVVALVMVTCLRVWLGSVDVLPRAQAQIPDSGLQRKQQLDALRESNRLLTEILSTLQSGTLNVRVDSTDKKGAGGGAPTGQRR